MHLNAHSYSFNFRFDQSRCKNRIRIGEATSTPFFRRLISFAGLDRLTSIRFIVVDSNSTDFRLRKSTYSSQSRCFFGLSKLRRKSIARFLNLPIFASLQHRLVCESAHIVCVRGRRASVWNGCSRLKLGQRNAAAADQAIRCTYSS